MTNLKCRDFSPIAIKREDGSGGFKRVHRFQCSQCQTHYDIAANTMTGSRATPDILKILNRSGWELGRNKLNDLCPDCASAKRRNGRKAPIYGASRPEMDDEMANPVKPAAAANPKLTVVAKNPPAAPPPEMSRSDRRIVFAKLHEVYLDKGYSKGWSDQKVADDLGTHIDWVKTVREADFGPAMDTQAVVDLLEELRRIGEEIKTLEPAYLSALDVMKKLDANMVELLARQERLSATVAELEKFTT